MRGERERPRMVERVERETVIKSERENGGGERETVIREGA